MREDTKRGLQSVGKLWAWIAGVVAAGIGVGYLMVVDVLYGLAAIAGIYAVGFSIIAFVWGKEGRR